MGPARETKCSSSTYEARRLATGAIATPPIPRDDAHSQRRAEWTAVAAPRQVRSLSLRGEVENSAPPLPPLGDAPDAAARYDADKRRVRRKKSAGFR